MPGVPSTCVHRLARSHAGIKARHFDVTRLAAAGVERESGQDGRDEHDDPARQRCAQARSRGRRNQRGDYGKGETDAPHHKVTTGLS